MTDDAGARARRLNEERFTATASLYASSGVADRRAENEALVRLAAPVHTDRVLDVACGPGVLVALLAARVGRVVGIDVTAAMLELARARLREAPAASLVRGEAARLPFRDGAFTLATTTSALHHFGDARAVLREMARVVASGGRAAVGDLVGVEDDGARARQNEIERLRDPAHVEVFSRPGIEALLRSAGLLVAGHVEGAMERELGEWLRISRTPPDRAAAVRERLLAMLADDGAGMAPVRDGGTVRFIHRWAVIAARRP